MSIPKALKSFNPVTLCYAGCQVRRRRREPECICEHWLCNQNPSGFAALTQHRWQTPMARLPRNKIPIDIIELQWKQQFSINKHGYILNHLMASTVWVFSDILLDLAWCSSLTSYDTKGKDEILNVSTLGDTVDRCDAWILPRGFTVWVNINVYSWH